MNRTLSKLILLALWLSVNACREDEVVIDPAVLTSPADVIARFNQLDNDCLLYTSVFSWHILQSPSRMFLC